MDAALDSLCGASDYMGGHLIDLLFYPVHEPYHPRDIWNKLVSQKLICETALKISNEWNVKQSTRNLANDNSLMEMCMDNVGAEFAACSEDLPQQ
jgi:hypothetical protein